MTHIPLPPRPKVRPSPGSKAAEFVPGLDDVFMFFGGHYLTADPAEWEARRDAYLAEEAKADTEAERSA